MANSITTIFIIATTLVALRHVDMAKRFSLYTMAEVTINNIDNSKNQSIVEHEIKDLAIFADLRQRDNNDL